jgi:hypothetical protein
VTLDGRPLAFAMVAGPAPDGVGDETVTPRWQAATSRTVTVAAMLRERVEFMSAE